MRSLKVSGIIHLFAVLHAVVALSCHLAGINDELVLTLLTIVLIVLICLKRGLNVEFTAASVIVVNVIGYLLGTGGAQLIELLLHAPPVVHAVSTFITTEILGWSIVWFTKLFRRGDDTASRSSAWTPRIGLLLLAVGVIFVLRLAYVELFASPSFSSDRLYHMADLLASNSAALIILLCVNIIYVRHTRRRETRHGLIAEIAAFLLFVLLTSACVALITGLHLPFAFDRSFSAREFLQLWIVTLLVEVTLYSVVFMVDYALVARAVLRAERGKAHQAQFRYMKLKQQVNPHFLFNSLNILDCLVCEQRTEQASAYIHKLAGIYRYMLQNEEETLVRLREADAAGHLHFIGNIEAKEAIKGGCDVIVTDGFSGNILLKTMEGVGSFAGSALKGMFKKNLLTKLAALAVMPGLRDFKAQLDPNKVGGTAFIGISKPVIKAHGASNAEAIENAVGQAKQFAQSGLVADIEANIDLMRVEKE